ncbi:hypothetical protein Sjap_022463 [Stephania japonica]|uniref:NAC domain-containing protein n=1 Tax=Stephania japonica TaxID=461633 RepID=A0AAP0ENY3_9MAGN
MEDSLQPHKPLSMTTPLLPPGFQFHPTSQQIFSYYLYHKNKKNDHFVINNNNSTDPSIAQALSLIPDIDDLSNYDPSDLPQNMCFPYGRGGVKKHWYCFAGNAGGGARRKGKGGVWKRRDRGEEVLGGGEGGEGGAVLGVETTFLFYRRDCSSSSSSPSRLERTDWVLIEYALVHQSQDSFVLCRVFFEPQCENKAQEQVQNNCAEDSNAETHRISKDVPCKQHDGTREKIVTNAAGNNSQFPLRLAGGEPGNQIVGAPLEVDRFRVPMSAPQPPRLDQQPDGPKSGGIKGDDAVAENVSTDYPFPEDDYIELNDLIGPLPGILDTELCSIVMCSEGFKNM